MDRRLAKPASHDNEVCLNCVTSFDLDSSILKHNGDYDTIKQPQPQRKIMVFFSDDQIYYTFEVLSSSNNVILVSNEHSRRSSLFQLRGENDIIGSDIQLLGAKLEIKDLETNRRYFVRVSSENSLMGTGVSIGTEPSSEIPRTYPSPPVGATVTVKDMHSVIVDWSTVRNDLPINSYKVECFTRSHVISESKSFFGSHEVIELDSTGLDVWGGTFFLYFGSPSAKMPGFVKVNPGQNFMISSKDLKQTLLNHFQRCLKAVFINLKALGCRISVKS